MLLFYKELCTDQDVLRPPPGRAVPAHGVRPGQRSAAGLLAPLLPAVADGSKAGICECPCSVPKTLRKEADTEKTAQRGLGQLQTRHRRLTPHPPPPPGRAHPKAEPHRVLQRSTDSPLPEGTDAPEPHVRGGQGVGLAPQRAEGATSVTVAPGKPSTSTSLSPDTYFTDKPTWSSKRDPKTSKKQELLSDRETPEMWAPARKTSGGHKPSAQAVSCVSLLTTLQPLLPRGPVHS